jgi:hypothetical protein
MKKTVKDAIIKLAWDVHDNHFLTDYDQRYVVLPEDTGTLSASLLLTYSEENYDVMIHSYRLACNLSKNEKDATQEYYFSVESGEVLSEIEAALLEFVETNS